MRFCVTYEKLSIFMGSNLIPYYTQPSKNPFLVPISILSPYEDVYVTKRLRVYTADASREEISHAAIGSVYWHNS